MPTTAPHPASTSTPIPVREHAATAEDAPLLLLFASRRSGQARRVEGYVAHVLQRRHNHDSFRFRIIEREDRPDLFDRLDVQQVPTLLVIDDKRVACKLEGYVRPHEVEEALTPWLH